MNKLLLFLILLPKNLWRTMGADVDQLRAILKVKLMLDDRRPMAMGRQQAKKKKPVRFMSLLSAFISAVIGFMYIFPMMLEDTYMGLWLYFSVFLIMLSIMLITDFSTVLFDTKDKSILLPRPVNERTLLLSRLLHMFIYLFRIVLPMSLGGWITMGINHGWRAAIWFPFAVIMLTLIALFLVNACYLLVLHFAKPGKFKDIINYFQISFSILFFACVYLLPRAVDSEGFQQLKYTDYPWAKLTPSFWLAASWSWFDPAKNATTLYLVAALALIGPLLLIYLTVKYLSPSFASRIGNIDVQSTETVKETKLEVSPKAPAVKAKKAFYLKLANWLNTSPLAKAGFSIAWLQTGRSRSFKMRIYPTFAYVPVYFFYIITQSKKPISEVWETLHHSSKYLLLLYMTSFVVLQLMAQLVFSDQYKASWIYYSSPVSKPGVVMGGAFKGVWVKYYLPMFVAVSCFVLAIWGPKILIDILLAYVNITLFALCVLRVAYRRLPFSAMEQMNEKGNRFLKTLFIMILPMGLGFGHYWTTITPWLWWMKIVFLVLSLILLWVLWDSYKNTAWEELKKVDIG